MVFKKQLNEKGKYIDQSGKRWEILSCERTEAKRYREIGSVQKEVYPGEFVDEPIIEGYIVVNEGWDAFGNESEAAVSYGLTYSPLQNKDNLLYIL